MKSGDSDLKFLCNALRLVSAIFGFTTDNEFEWKQIRMLQFCNSACLCLWMGLAVTRLSHPLLLSLLLLPFLAHN
jgi:hypothetical protein